MKHENATPTGAFKVRGGLVYVDHLVHERPHVTGLVSATRGDHGQSLAFAGRTHGLAVRIVVPRGNSPEKNDAMRAFGAELVVHGSDFQEALEHAASLAGGPDRELVPPFHPDLVVGVATYARELFEQAGPLDVVYVPVGMGSGIAATAAAMRVLHRSTHSLAEPAGAIALAGALSERVAVAGRRVGVVLTGGNVDAPVLAKVLAGGTPTV